MKSFLPELKRVMGAMVYANHASNLNQLNKLLEQDGITPAPISLNQNVARERNVVFIPKGRHLRLVD
jgi:hypothetical protein